METTVIVWWLWLLKQKVHFLVNYYVQMLWLICSGDALKPFQLERAHKTEI